jgi:hypothetical protein
LSDCGPPLAHKWLRKPSERPLSHGTQALARCIGDKLSPRAGKPCICSVFMHVRPLRPVFKANLSPPDLSPAQAKLLIINKLSDVTFWYPTCI